ncbi:unnamed protein product [Mytilus coruscus]|uniref:WW domain-containing protein n=1 Tax=Mytilus coruscus TaxID=42192 RepID=A0A6J8A8G1_MYTCO|nr:unnamed protein product [Mytilus coruscus]
MSKLTWIPPLPPGYEARWDHNQKAYFFINHSDKSTTWHDPRPEYYAKQPKDHPPPNPKHSAAGQPVFGFRGSGIGPKKSQSLDQIATMFCPDLPLQSHRVDQIAMMFSPDLPAQSQKVDQIAMMFLLTYLYSHRKWTRLPQCFLLTCTVTESGSDCHNVFFRLSRTVTESGSDCHDVFS